MSAQQQLRKVLEKNYGFEFVSMKATGFGERWHMRCNEAGIEAQIGAHRICFYACSLEKSEVDASLQNNLPTTLRPLCFDTDEKTNIRLFLEKILQVSGKNTKQKVLFAEA